ncbi:MAG: 3-phosphoshikimate 1-carboxyvinyltransferase [Mogibacterium sp.]|nr:3-phosphoshikimate 1-carboxyvinyltransferase [Mogibacterium sp.]
MRYRIEKAANKGMAQAIPSKSAAHRWLIVAALSGLDYGDRLKGLSEDVDATRECLVEIRTSLDGAAGLNGAAGRSGVLKLRVRESGSTLRFLLPLAAALGLNADFICEGKLADRPLAELKAALEERGCRFEQPAEGAIGIRGRLSAGEFRIPGNVSSQYVSGLIFALPLLEGDSCIVIEGELESRPYVDMTLAAVRAAGIEVEETEAGFEIKGGQKYALESLPEIEGDWSSAANWIVLDALNKARVEDYKEIIVLGLDENSLQGDKAIREYVKLLDKKMETNGYSKKVDVIDVRNTPDLVPLLAVLACAREKGCVTRIENAGRLRFKESDRLESTAAMIRSLGGRVEEGEDYLLIDGQVRLDGGEVDSYGDHRIVMAAAVAAAICENPVVLDGAEATRKSYPGFFEDFASLGGVFTEA